MYKCRRGVWRLGGGRVADVAYTTRFQKTPQRYEIGCQLLLITNRKSRTGFQLVLTSMTLNDVIALILRFFIKFYSFAGRLCHSG